MRLVTKTTAYRKSYKRFIRSGSFSVKELNFVINKLVASEILEPAYRDHELKGKFIGNRECHIKGGLLLMYRIENNDLVLVLVNLGTHTELFD